jgi:hypothetical protein
VNIKIRLMVQLDNIEKRMDNVDDFKELAILQIAKTKVLTALQKYEDQ